MDFEELKVSFGEPKASLVGMNVNLADLNVNYEDPNNMDLKKSNVSYAEMKNVNFGEWQNIISEDIRIMDVENELPSEFLEDDDSNATGKFSETNIICY